MAKPYGKILFILWSLVGLYAAQSLCSAISPIDVLIVSFGYPGGRVFEFVPQLTVSGPPYSLAVDELNRRYNRTFNFTYVNAGSPSCLSAKGLEKPTDVLADFYYKIIRPKRIVLFVIPDTEPGTNNIFKENC